MSEGGALVHVHDWRRTGPQGRDPRPLALPLHLASRGACLGRACDPGAAGRQVMFLLRLTVAQKFGTCC